MAFDKITMLTYCTVVLLLLLSFNRGNNAESSSCGVTREENRIVDIKKSRATSNTAKAIKGLNLTDESSCRDQCCGDTECTVYVYYNSKQRQFNCFLIKCEPVSKCVRSTLQGSVVGTMNRKADNAIHPSQVTSFKSKQGVTLETSITQSPIDTSPTSVEQPAQRGMSPNLTSEHKVSATSTSLSLVSSTAASVQSPTSPTHVIHTEHVNTTHKQTTTRNPSSQHNHTNKTSLVIALFFGLLFLVAVVIIVGRPWWEFIQRPRYSKVDYLMNGL